VLYLDSSAIVKLVVREPETGDLVEAVRADHTVVTSALAVTEVIRAVARSGTRAVRAEAVLDGIALIPIDEGILRAAASLAPRDLRTLDAIHLASALSFGRDLASLVTYDQRLAEAATGAGIDVRSPGASGS
jgi:hypothetical protein